MTRKLARLLIGFGAGLCALPAQAEVVDRGESSFVVRMAAEVPADPFVSWATLTAPGKWWSSEHTWSGKAENLYIDSQATGCFCELMPVPAGAPEGTRRGSVEHMHIVNSSPGSMLRMTGALGPLQSEAVKGVLTISLKPGTKGTRIEWEYAVGGYMRFKTAMIAQAVDEVLGEQLDRLARKLGGDGLEKAAPAPALPAEPAASPPSPAEAEMPPAGATDEPKDVMAQFDEALPGAGAGEAGNAAPPEGR